MTHPQHLCGGRCMVPSWKVTQDLVTLALRVLLPVSGPVGGSDLMECQPYVVVVVIPNLIIIVAALET